MCGIAVAAMAATRTLITVLWRVGMYAEMCLDFQPLAQLSRHAVGLQVSVPRIEEFSGQSAASQDS